MESQQYKEVDEINILSKTAHNIQVTFEDIHIGLELASIIIKNSDFTGIDGMGTFRRAIHHKTIKVNGVLITNHMHILNTLLFDKYIVIELKNLKHPILITAVS